MDRAWLESLLVEETRARRAPAPVTLWFSHHSDQKPLPLVALAVVNTDVRRDLVAGVFWLGLGRLGGADSGDMPQRLPPCLACPSSQCVVAFYFYTSLLRHVQACSHVRRGAAGRI